MRNRTLTNEGADTMRGMPRDDSIECVAVIVVMYKSESMLSEFVESLPSGFGTVPYKLIAVDNASPDGSAELIRKLAPDATVVETGRNGGYAAGINAGVEVAGKYTAILVVNSDVRLKPGCVPELMRQMRGSSGVGIVVPKLIDGHGRLIESMRREPSVRHALFDAILGASLAGRIGRLGEVVTRTSAYDQQQLTDWAEGSTQLISLECWLACGGWDESFFLYSEETEFDLRARDRGYATLYVPTATAVHLEGGSGSSDWLWALQVVNRVFLFRLRNGAIRTPLFWVATMLREGSRALLGHRRSRLAVRALLHPNRFRASVVPKS